MVWYAFFQATLFFRHGTYQTFLQALMNILLLTLLAIFVFEVYLFVRIFFKSLFRRNIQIKLKKMTQ